MSGGNDVSRINTMLFVVEGDPAARERIRALLAAAGYAVAGLDSLETAASLLRNRVACHLLVLSAEALAGHEDELDALLDEVAPSPMVIVCGVDAGGRKAALHGLASGVCDFLAKPYDERELLDAVENALRRDRTPILQAGDHIVASSPVLGWIELTAPSELEHLRRMERFFEALFASSLPEKVCGDMKMAVEEVGRNAMEWGNRFDSGKQVHLSYCIFDDRIVIKCEDEGEGFKPQAVPNPMEDPVKAMLSRQEAGKRPGGYGVYLLQKLVDQVVYSEKGNSVLMTKFLNNKPGVIQPAKNVLPCADIFMPMAGKDMLFAAGQGQLGVIVPYRYSCDRVVKPAAAVNLSRHARIVNPGVIPFYNLVLFYKNFFRFRIVIVSEEEMAAGPQGIRRFFDKELLCGLIVAAMFYIHQRIVAKNHHIVAAAPIGGERVSM